LTRLLDENTYARLQNYRERVGAATLSKVLEYWMDEEGDFIIDNLEERIHRAERKSRAERALLFIKSGSRVRS